jgi:hypothetical protein
MVDELATLGIQLMVTFWCDVKWSLQDDIL